MSRIHRIGRRFFLGGAGALVALPMLETFMGDKAYADSSFPARFLAFYVPNGIHMARWTPQQSGPSPTLPSILAPLAGDGNLKADVSGKVNILTGLSNILGSPDGPGDHAGGTSAFLTCAHANKSESNISLGISADQVIANALAANMATQTAVPSMQLGIDGGDNSGGCDSGYSCAYTRNISWASTTQALSKLTSPRGAYNQIFGGTDPAASAAERAKQRLYRTRVLDYVRDQAASLNPKLSHVDRTKLDEYFTGIVALEDKIIQQEQNVCEAIPEPNSNYPLLEHIDIMLDLMVHAFKCDTTRVITFMLANAGSGRSHDFVGVTENHHSLSHHEGLQTNFDKLTIIDTWEVEMYAELLRRMDATIEGTGTMLDHSQVFFSSEIEDGNAHRHRNLPVLVGGGCHDAYTTGRHIVHEDNPNTDGPPIANLFLTMMQSMGVNETSFGDSTGLLTELA